MLECEYNWEQEHYVNIGPKERNKFLAHHVILKNICSKREEYITLGFISNVLKDHIIEGEMLGLCNFGVMVEQVISGCNKCSLLVQPMNIISWPIDKLLDQKNGTLLQVQGIHQSNRSSSSYIEYLNLRFKGLLVKLTHL